MMKRGKSLFFLVALLCGSSVSFGQAMSAAETAELLAGGRFRFVAQTAHTTLRNLSTVNLDTYYAAEFCGDSVLMSLPYMGQRYNARRETTDSPLNFESVMGLPSKTGDVKEKRGETKSFEMRNKNIAVTFKCVLRVFDNGRATLQVTATNYSKIDFNGYIAPYKTVTKKYEPKISK